MADDKDQNNKNGLSEEEQRLWDYAMQGVEPIKRDKPKKDYKTSLNSSEKRSLNKAKAPKVIIEEKFISKKKATKEHNLHDHADIDRSSFDKFRKGQMPIEATIDLHGLNQEQAYNHLKSFISNAVARGQRCVMVITGKGYKRNDQGQREEGVLKRSLPEWLEQPAFKQHVLKIQQAQRFHGGSGAYYILLKRRR